MDSRKTLILDALQAFIAQRPGMDPRNYDRAGYLKESREVTRDRHQAEKLLAAVKWREGITADALIEASKRAYSGRLTLSQHKDHDTSVDPWHVDYCTGQYFPTEYRRAVCAVLASALWYHAREEYAGQLSAASAGNAVAPQVSAGDWLRAHFRKEFGKAIQERWFN